MRVRGFTQDDAHIFCTEEQVEPEVVRFIDLLRRVYADFGFDEILVKLSTRPAKRVGTDGQWDQAEAALKSALDNKGSPTSCSRAKARFTVPRSSSR
jgi:threonyl-tRNA synthetase